MKKPIPTELLNEKNEQVLTYLEGKSCHGDILEPLEKIVRHYDQVKSFCADSASFAYRLWYVENRVIAFAIGMQHVNFWVPGLRPGTFGTQSYPKAGPDWYSIAWDHPYLEQLLKASLATCDSEQLNREGQGSTH